MIRSGKKDDHEETKKAYIQDSPEVFATQATTYYLSGAPSYKIGFPRIRQNAEI